MIKAAPVSLLKRTTVLLAGIRTRSTRTKLRREMRSNASLIAEIGGRKGRAGPWKGTLEELKKRVENDVRERRYWAARRDEEVAMKKTTASGNNTDPAASAAEMGAALAALDDDNPPELPPSLVWEDTEDRFILRAPAGDGSYRVWRTPEKTWNGSYFAADGTERRIGVWKTLARPNTTSLSTGSTRLTGRRLCRIRKTSRLRCNPVPNRLSPGYE
jgi:hypothetical protein